MNKNHNINNKIRASEGNTLVELLIYMALMSILLVVLAQIFGMVSDFDLEYRSYSSAQSEGMFLINKLSFDIKNADNILTPANVGNSGPTLTIITSGTTATYSVSGGIVTLNDGSDSYDLNSNETNVNEIMFTRIGNPSGKNSIKIEFTIQSNILSKGIGKSKNFINTVSLR